MEFTRATLYLLLNSPKPLWLVGADLSEADLRGADLREADLREADLHRAYLGEADLRRASLPDANLSGAYLRGANLRDANLSDANLTGADLSAANWFSIGLYIPLPARSSFPYWATTALNSQSYSVSLQPRHGLAPAAVTRPNATMP